MSNFKPNERVVFINPHLCKHPLMVCPKHGEIITINCFEYIRDGYHFYSLKEYPRSICGTKEQAFDQEDFLRKLSDFGKEESERIASEIEETFEPILTPELV